jgi:hypothetical protein
MEQNNISGQGIYNIPDLWIVKSKQLPEHLKDRENDLFMKFYDENTSLKKAIAFKKWKDFIFNNIPKNEDLKEVKIHKSTIQDKINQLIPYISQEFITYDLWEEGNYTPFIHFWQIFNDINEYNSFYLKVKKLFHEKNYEIELFNEDYLYFLKLKKQKAATFEIYPKYDYTDVGGVEYANPDWSIEEIIDLIVKITNNA